MAYNQNRGSDRAVKWFFILIAVLILAWMAMVLLSGAGMAQTPDTVVTLGSEAAHWAEVFTGSVLSIAAAFVSYYVRNAFLRRALHIALTQGAGLIIREVGDQVRSIRFDARDPRVARAIRYVQHAAPGGLKWWGITPESIAEKLEGKVGVLIAPQIAAQPPMQSSPALHSTGPSVGR